MFKFNKDIDNDEEDELSDGSLKERIKERKIKERNLRAELTVINKAAVDTMRNVEKEKSRIKVRSLIEKSLNLKDLKEKQARIKRKIDESDMRFNDKMDEGLGVTDGNIPNLNQNSGDLANSSAISFGIDHNGLPIDPSMQFVVGVPQEPSPVVEEQS